MQLHFASPCDISQIRGDFLPVGYLYLLYRDSHGLGDPLGREWGDNLTWRAPCADLEMTGLGTGMDGTSDDETTDGVARTLCAGFVPLCLETSVADGVVKRVPVPLYGLELGAVVKPDTWVRRMADMTGVWGWFGRLLLCRQLKWQFSP